MTEHNIGPLQKRRRLRIGLLALLLACSLLALLLWLQAPLWWRLGILPLLWLSPLGLLQAREKT